MIRCVEGEEVTRRGDSEVARLFVGPVVVWEMWSSNRDALHMTRTRKDARLRSVDAALECVEKMRKHR